VTADAGAPAAAGMPPPAERGFAPVVLRTAVTVVVSLVAHELMMRWARGHPGRAALVVALQSWRSWRSLSAPLP